MPPRLAKLPATVLFTGTAGDSRKLDAAFRASLLGEGPLSVDPAHWILTVLPSLSPADVTMRLLVFVFLPAFVLANDLDEEIGSVLFYPAPVCVSRLLHRLIKEGISAEPAPDVRTLRERVLAHSLLLPVAFRQLARADVVVVKVPPSCALASMFPLMFRGPDAHNGALATFLATLPGYFTGVTRGLMPAALAAVVPPSVSPSDPPSLLALTCVAHIRTTQPAPPFDSFLAFGDLIPELMRLRMPSAEARFVPLFDRDWRRAYPILPRIFRGVTSATEMRQHLRTLAVALRVPFDSFSESTVRGVCISVSHLVSELEVELPSTASTPSPDEVIATLVRLVRRAGTSSDSVLSTGADSSRAAHPDDAGYSKLLAIPDFADLYSKVVALNTSAFHAPLAISLALSHPHPAALIVMITTKSLPQPGWSSVIGAMRQKSSWPTVFDKALAVNADGEIAHDWGVMLPVDSKGVSTVVNCLVTGKLHLITDWWSSLSKWVSLYVGTHVLLLPEYAATSDPHDFWLSASRMRLVSPAMYAIFSVIRPRRPR